MLWAGVGLSPQCLLSVLAHSGCWIWCFHVALGFLLFVLDCSMVCAGGFGLFHIIQLLMEKACLMLAVGILLVALVS